MLQPASSGEAATAERISRLLNSAVAQTRSLARGLHPIDPAPSGLKTALEDLASRTAELFKVECNFDCPRLVPVKDNTTATHLYQIAQEAVGNAIKHGRAQHIRLCATTERLVLTISDDGFGFRKKAGERKGLGLRIMSYRAGVIGGTLAVHRKPTGGVEIICTVRKPAVPR